MEKLKFIGVAVALLSCTASITADDPPDMTAGALNGRYWRKLSLMEKAAFVTGFDTAMNVALVVSPENREKFSIRAPTYGDAVHMMDSFYRRHDEKLPIWTAIRMIKLEEDGLSESEIGDRMAADGIWRKVKPETPK